MYNVSYRKPLFLGFFAGDYSKYEHRKGFTLIELLVVIAIIALLVSILMPALHKARSLAQVSVCSTSLRQFAIANQSYGTDNDGRNVPSWACTTMEMHITPRHWHTFFKPYIGDTKDLIKCPAAKDPDMSKVAADISVHGTADKSWYCQVSIHTMGKRYEWGGFGYNNWLEWDSGGQHLAILKSSKASFPAQVAAFGDCTWPDAGWVSESDIIPAESFWFNPEIAYSSGWVRRFCMDRHMGAVDIAFLDTHVQRVPVDDLLKFRWHKKWKASSVR